MFSGSGLKNSELTSQHPAMNVLVVNGVTVRICNFGDVANVSTMSVKILLMR